MVQIFFAVAGTMGEFGYHSELTSVEFIKHTDIASVVCCNKRLYVSGIHAQRVNITIIYYIYLHPLTGQRVYKQS